MRFYLVDCEISQGYWLSAVPLAWRVFARPQKSPHKHRLDTVLDLIIPSISWSSYWASFSSDEGIAGAAQSTIEWGLPQDEMGNQIK
jgi:hypothetical protein